MPRFADRHAAGRALARELRAYADRPDVVVLGLPRGGVPVAAEVAAALHAPLDILLVRKLGVPGHEELAMGAIAEDGARFVNAELVEQLGIPPAVVSRTVDRERRALAEREALYRGERGTVPVRDRRVIVVDDGLATGASMLAAVRVLRSRGPRAVIAAAPVASREACRLLAGDVDACIAVATPEPFLGVGAWYADFAPTSDEEVRRILLGERTASEPR